MLAVILIVCAGWLSFGWRSGSPSGTGSGPGRRSRGRRRPCWPAAWRRRHSRSGWRAAARSALQRLGRVQGLRRAPQVQGPSASPALPDRAAISTGGRARRLLQRAPDRHRAGHLRVLVGRDGDLPTFVRDAHNLYLETLGSLIPGLVLLLAALGSVFVIGAGKWRRAEGYERALLAAALAAGAAFATAAAIDWVWEMTVIPVALLLLAAAMLRTSARPPAGGTRDRRVDQSEDRARRSGAGLAGGDRDADAGGPRGAPEPGRRARGAAGQCPGRRSKRRAIRGVRRHRQPAARPGARGQGDLEEAAAAARRPPARNRPTGAPGSPCLGSRPSADSRRPPSTPIAPRALSIPARPCSQAARRGTIMRPSQMPDPERDDPRAEAGPAERERLLETARLLEQARPRPRPAFRGALARAAGALHRPTAAAIADRRLRRLGPGPARGGGGRAGRSRAPGPG